VVTALGYGTTGLWVGERVFGLADWYRDGTLAEYVAMEARNLYPRSRGWVKLRSAEGRFSSTKAERLRYQINAPSSPTAYH
jgi:hypothetical protein